MRVSGSLADRRRALRRSRLWSEIPGRLARQVVALDRLPYGLCLMPSIREIRDNYMRSFDEMTETPEPATFEACLAFTRAIEAIYARHGGMFSQVAKGIFELQREMARNNSNPEDVEAFVQFAEVRETLSIVTHAFGLSVARTVMSGVIIFVFCRMLGFISGFI